MGCVENAHLCLNGVIVEVPKKQKLWADYLAY
jgi:hypothetical protein